MKLSLSTKTGLAVIRSTCKNENGAALVIGLMFIAILAMLGSTAVVMTTTDMQIGSNFQASVVALNDAEAGIYYAIGKIEEGLKAWPRTFTLPTSTVPSSKNGSDLITASNPSFPIPGQLKIISIKKAPANSSASDPEIAVSTGLKAFLKACFDSTAARERPFARAVII